MTALSFKIGTAVGRMGETTIFEVGQCDLHEIHQFSHGKNGRGSKTMYFISDHRANIFGISGASMEHNATAK